MWIKCFYLLENSDEEVKKVHTLPLILKKNIQKVSYSYYFNIIDISYILSVANKAFPS